MTSANRKRHLRSYNVHIVQGEVGVVRRCIGRRSTIGSVLIAAGLVLLIFALPLEFWAAVLGVVLIVAGVILLAIER